MSDSVEKLRAQAKRLSERASGYRIAGDYQMNRSAATAAAAIAYAANMLDAFEALEFSTRAAAHQVAEH